MSDIDRPVPYRAPVPVARKCHCDDWAGFGFAKGNQQQWWCWQHYPYKTSSRLEAAEIADFITNRVA